jgi:hypothetical protein
MLYPFKSKVTFEAPMEIQAAPLTVQVTSPVSRLLSVMVNVEEIVPLMSLQYAIVAHARSATTEEEIGPPTLRLIYLSWAQMANVPESPPRFGSESTGSYYVQRYVSMILIENQLQFQPPTWSTGSH